MAFTMNRAPGLRARLGDEQIAEIIGRTLERIRFSWTAYAHGSGSINML